MTLDEFMGDCRALANFDWPSAWTGDAEVRDWCCGRLPTRHL